jgi:ribosomal protein S18 acetylase RimI-like enzyme
VKRSTILTIGHDRLRVGPWRGDARTAQLTPVAPGTSPSMQAIAQCLDRLRRQGYERAITSALTLEEQPGFAEAGFTVHEHLHLLSHRFDAPDPDALPAAARGRSSRGLRRRPTLTLDSTTTKTQLRRARRGDRPAVLRIDGLAFDAFWRFDHDGLREALTATPVARFRVACDREVVGYAVTGRSHDRGYLQRLAVHPDRHHEGIGRSLVLDALTWLRRRGTTSVLVNTQESNTAALALYQDLGFTREPHGLDVLERGLVGDGLGP